MWLRFMKKAVDLLIGGPLLIAFGIGVKLNA